MAAHRFAWKRRSPLEINHAVLIRLTMINICSFVASHKAAHLVRERMLSDQDNQESGHLALMPRANLPSLLLVSVVLFCPSKALPQGETTSAIVGQVSDASGAPIPNAKVTVTNKDTGLRRSASTDDSGRFNFPQLKPGPYSVKVEAGGFDPQQNDAVSSALGQKQTVDFSLKIAQSNQTVTITSQAPILNLENANTSTTLNAHALEDLPNPGGDLTYPLQFAAGALVNTAGSGNDFVGVRTGMAMWSSMDFPLCQTAILSMAWKRMIR